MEVVEDLNLLEVVDESTYLEVKEVLNMINQAIVHVSSSIVQTVHLPNALFIKWDGGGGGGGGAACCWTWWNWTICCWIWLICAWIWIAKCVCCLANWLYFSSNAASVVSTIGAYSKRIASYSIIRTNEISSVYLVFYLLLNISLLETHLVISIRKRKRFVNLVVHRMNRDRPASFHPKSNDFSPINQVTEKVNIWYSSRTEQSKSFTLISFCLLSSFDWSIVKQ